MWVIIRAYMCEDIGNEKEGTILTINSIFLSVYRQTYIISSSPCNPCCRYHLQRTDKEREEGLERLKTKGEEKYWDSNADVWAPSLVFLYYIVIAV